MASADFIITPADVRRRIGLVSNRMDPAIAVAISLIGIDLESKYHRSLRVGSAPAGSEDYFIAKVGQWANDQADISALIARERRSAVPA